MNASWQLLCYVTWKLSVSVNTYILLFTEIFIIPLFGRISGNIFWVPIINPNTLISAILRYVFIGIHSTSPKVDHPALWTKPHNFTLEFWIWSTQASHSFSSVTLSWITSIPYWRNSVAPSFSAKRQPAKTLKPSLCSFLANWKPNPVSQPNVLILIFLKIFLWFRARSCYS